MEPRALTPFKDTAEIDKTQRALAEISLNQGMLIDSKTDGRC